MEIDANGYYRIVTNQEFHDAGLQFLEDLAAKLQAIGHPDADDVIGLGGGRVLHGCSVFYRFCAFE